MPILELSFLHHNVNLLCIKPKGVKGNYTEFFKEYICRNYLFRDIQIYYNQYGKPFLYGADMHFNISHSGEWAICAISSGEVGVDVQYINNKKKAFLMEYLSENEIDLANKSGCPIRSLTLIWTIKESYSKYIGKGLHAINDVEVISIYPIPNVYCINHHKERYVFHCGFLDYFHVYTMCYNDKSIDYVHSKKGKV